MLYRHDVHAVGRQIWVSEMEAAPAEAYWYVRQLKMRQVSLFYWWQCNFPILLIQRELLTCWLVAGRVHCFTIVMASVWYVTATRHIDIVSFSLFRNMQCLQMSPRHILGCHNMPWCHVLSFESLRRHVVMQTYLAKFPTIGKGFTLRLLLCPRWKSKNIVVARLCIM